MSTMYMGDIDDKTSPGIGGISFKADDLPQVRPRKKWSRFFGRMIISLVVGAGIAGGALWVWQNLVVSPSREMTKDIDYQAVKDFGFTPISFSGAERGNENSVDSVLAKYGTCVFRFTFEQQPLGSGKTTSAVVMWVDGKKFAVDPSATLLAGRAEFTPCVPKME